MVRREVPAQSFARAVAGELDVRGFVPGRSGDEAATLHTLYLGGGTPSRLGADGVGWLLDALRARFALAPDAEVTLEANPEDITVDAVRAWRAHGVNRLSIGMQSFDDRVLAWMHRVHDASAAVRAAADAREGGIAAFSLDLIFAVPEALERDWARDLAHAVALAPDHVSLYGLTVESGTPLGRWRERGEAIEAPEERYEADFLRAHHALTTAGYEHYEVSNFGRPGRRARHNSAYWHGAPYLGVGPSAHGFDGDTRRWNVRELPAWERAVADHADPVAGAERLTTDNRAAETVYLGLRTVDGLAVTAAERVALASWRDAGWVEDVPDAPEPRLRCTPDGWMRLDALAADLTARRSR